MKGGGEHRRHRHTHEGMRMKDIRGAVAKAIIPNIPHVMSCVWCRSRSVCLPMILSDNFFFLFDI